MIKKGIYRHYKNREYQLIDEVVHSETREPMVLYRPLYGERLLAVRPYETFFENVQVDGREVPRFTWIRDIE